MGNKSTTPKVPMPMTEKLAHGEKVWTTRKISKNQKFRKNFSGQSKLGLPKFFGWSKLFHHGLCYDPDFCC
jgi:hypothetical protein